ncbi:MAG: hypothetical protein LHV68_13405 [Elusimicrobia bacterium]|nr:hypothetical protein [Candidatus Liberimonas magnetica]
MRSRKLNKGESADFEPLNPRLEFHDTNGKTFKTISLETDSKIIPRKTEEKIIKSKYLTEKAVITSNDKQYALLSIFTGFSADIDEKGNEQLYYDRVSTCKLEFYDANGVLLWEKQMPEGVSCGDAKFSDNGEIIYVPVGLAETTYTAHIYNKKGDLLLNVPWGSEPVMSPNGKYLALRVAGNPTSTIFYNLENGKSWNPGKRLTIPINGFSNNGKVIVDDIKDKSSFVIDLKQYIGD